MKNGFSVFITPAGERSYKKLPTRVVRFVERDLIALLEKNPHRGEPLALPLQPLRSFHFSQNGQPYRVAYALNESERKVFIYFIGHRRDFYERLRRLLGQ